MTIEMSSKVTCYRCGESFSKAKGYFPVSYAAQHRGVGYLPVCRQCVDVMYLAYLEQCDDTKKIIKQMCRKLDIYWSESLYETVANKSSMRTMMNDYLSRLTAKSYAGKSYDDTIIEEDGSLWSKTIQFEEKVKAEEVSDKVKQFWGTGYTPEMYKQLEDRRQYWMDGLPEEFDTGAGSEAIIRQICALELDINKLRADGQPVDKLVSTLSNLIGSLNLKPSQKKQDDDTGLANTPLGVWLYRYENERPLPVVEDENKIRKTVFTWMGHVCKMLGKKNAYTQLYEDEIARLRVEKPEFEEDDDETFMMDVLTSDEDGDSS